ncbi:MAG: hydroxyacylglutathione hydrolase [Myxococcales bacterium]|nr:hydroxyacylglutathione hydrolase [Myxococcales bacterium]
MAPRVVPVPCLRDNYAYLVHAPGSREALVVDPSEAEPVLAALARESLTLSAVLCTHHHHDHVGGNEGLLAVFPGLTVVASAHDRGRVPCTTRTMNDGDVMTFAGLEARAIAVPGHTLGAVAYVIDDAVFTGDTMFVAGCGRLFEGTPAMMHESLSHKIARLPPETRVYCGHEYTQSNVRFALAVEPDNEALQALAERARAARERGEPTVPSTVAAEIQHNPFLRVAIPHVAARYGAADPVHVLGAMRAEKDDFR